MVFSSPVFLALFLPLLFLFYVFFRYRTFALLAGSLLFYSWGEPAALAVMLVVIAVNYGLALLIGGCASGGRKAKFYLTSGIVLDLTILLVFKYLSFAVGNLNCLFRPLGFSLNDPAIPLPIGISFYIFQAVSYLVDVYRREVAPQKNLVSFAFYVSFFPQLIAGPIVRYKTIESEIPDRALKPDNISSGLQRFAVGLAKKVLVADYMGGIADVVFSAPAETVPAVYCWIGAAAYMLQIFYDFSGYSDMAIGLGRMFNFHFLENFDLPYSARSLSDFWRRWHISLSSWFRDYLYSPLGGNRRGTARTCLNLMTVFLLCGLWHGAAWNFIVWGIWHGIGLLAERLGRGRSWSLPPVCGNLFVLLFVLVGWVIFRAPTLDYACVFLGNMFTGNGRVSGFAYPDMLKFFTFGNVVLFVAGWIFAYAPANGYLKSRSYPVKAVGAFLLLAVAFIFAMTSWFSPFIYFRF